MKNIKLILVGSITLLTASCGSSDTSREKYLSRIQKVETEMKKSDEINLAVADSAINAYSAYAGAFPNDSLSPDYLFKAGEVATGVKKYQEALTYYQTVTSKYPNYKHIRESLYLQGFLLDNFLNDDAKAKIVYEEIIAKYPNTNTARDSKAAIENLGKSDEQLIKEFKEKNGEK